jgi:uncharacterized protein YmfQ (DUF2313 family)
MSFFKLRNSDQQTNTKAQYMPNGLIWEAKQKAGSNFRNLLAGLCVEIARLEEKQNEIYKEMNPQETDALLSEWEALVGIPDECFPLADTIEERRKNLIFKLTASMNGTAEDFENLASILGLTVKVKTGVEEITFPMPFPIPMIGTLEEAGFVMIVDFIGVSLPNSFPLTLPITFTADPTSAVKCLFDKLKPANVMIIYRYK